MLIFRLHFHHEGLECEKKIFWDVFSGMAWYVSMKNFRFHSTALQFLCNKCHILIIFGEKIFFLKNICSFTPVIKISSKSDQKWAKTRHLLWKMFKTPKCLLLPHCAMDESGWNLIKMDESGWKWMENNGVEVDHHSAIPPSLMVLFVWSEHLF